MKNTPILDRFHASKIFIAAAMIGLAAPAVQAADTSADVGVSTPDEPDDDSFDAVVSGVGNDSDAHAIFQAWKRLDTGLTASIGIAVPSRKPIEAMRLSSSFGTRVHPITGKVARHNGIDIPAPRGTPIHATADGIVGRAQRLGGYGNYVEIEHGNDIETRYGHMSSFIVQSGQKVKRGEIIGYVGSTGRSTGNHLHYEVRIDGSPVNPLPFVHSDQLALAAISGDDEAAIGGPQDEY